MSAGIHDRRSHQGSRGVALVTVLWISSLLALIAAGVGSSTRTDIRLAYNLLEQAKARALADAGVHQAVFTLVTTPNVQQWQNGGAVEELALDDGSIRILVSDEDAKLDLNAAPIELFQGLFRAIGLDEGQAGLLADRLGDFRDEDSDPEPFGAEDDAYLAAGRPEGAADRPFLKIGELADILGMNDRIYRLVRPYVTVQSDIGAVDPTRAAPVVLQALPGITPELAGSLTTLSPNSDPLLALPTDVAADVEAFLIPSRDLTYSIEALGISEGGGRFLREAIVAIDGGTRGLAFTTLAWERGRLPETENTAQ